MKDILDSLNEMFDSLYNTATGRAGGGHDSGDPDLDRAWKDLDAFMGSAASQPGSRAGFREMDRDFAEFDRRFAAAANFEQLKAQAQAQAEANQRERQQQDARQSSRNAKEPMDPLEAIARELVRDYHNLELKPGASLEEVRAAYKRLVKQYHPDRFASDPGKQATATQITARLNQSYARVMDHLGQK